MRRDHRDVVIEMLAENESGVIAQLADMTIERNAYRDIARAAIHMIADLTRQLRRHRTSHHHLIDEFRRLREQTKRSSEAA
jgi:hypothetical protein